VREVQHHHAHVAAVMAEHGLDGSVPVLGFAFDGTGFGIGDNGLPEIWGGEVLRADYDGFERVAHLVSLPLPGGDAAVQNPCRIAVAYLTALGLPCAEGLPAVAACDGTELTVVQQQVRRHVGCVNTTSMGRLFDVVASLIGVRHRITYEAQAAIELEILAELATDTEPRWSFEVDTPGVIDPRSVIAGVVDDTLAGIPAATVARSFHLAVAAMVTRIACDVTADAAPRTVALTGGVFQNALLARLTRGSLHAAGFDVLTHRLVPPNDGGLSLGQAIIAGHRRR
jgi:hydrogenase maturation protein HypF